MNKEKKKGNKTLKRIGTLLLVIAILILIVTVTTFFRDFARGLSHFMRGQMIIIVICVIAIAIGWVIRKFGKGKK